MDEHNHSENLTSEKTAENESEKKRYTGGDTGAQFVKSIGVAGCVFFLGLFIVFLVFCFTSGSREPYVPAPEFSHVLSGFTGGVLNG